MKLIKTDHLTCLRRPAGLKFQKKDVYMFSDEPGNPKENSSYQGGNPSVENQGELVFPVSFAQTVADFEIQEGT
jgi:hypothetical protein